VGDVATLGMHFLDSRTPEKTAGTWQLRLPRDPTSLDPLKTNRGKKYRDFKLTPLRAEFWS